WSNGVGDFCANADEGFVLVGSPHRVQWSVRAIRGLQIFQPCGFPAAGADSNPNDPKPFRRKRSSNFRHFLLADKFRSQEILRYEENRDFRGSEGFFNFSKPVV